MEYAKKVGRIVKEASNSVHEINVFGRLHL
jgi:hypothetical protein